MVLLILIDSILNVVNDFVFTFQYGATDTAIEPIPSISLPKFTFQYGATDTKKA